MAINFIYRETPTWAINWVNKVYTLANTIDKLEEVYVWEAPYRTIDTVAWNQVTLHEAVPTWETISIDYFKV